MDISGDVEAKRRTLKFRDRKRENEIDYHRNRRGLCNKCRTIFIPSLECLKIPHGRITKDGQRFLLELTIEDGISLRKAKRRIKNTFGLEISVDRLWYLIQSTGKKCNDKTNEIVVNFSGIVCYDEDIMLYRLFQDRFGNDDWLNIMEFGDKIFNFIKSMESAVLSKLGIA